MFNNMKITKVNVYPVTSDSRLKATARIVFNDCLMLTSLKIYLGSQGLFVAYPVEGTLKGEEFRQIFYPLRKELREYVESAIIEKYNSIIKASQ